MTIEKKHIANFIYSMIALFFIALFAALIQKWGTLNSSYELGQATGAEFRILLKKYVLIAFVYLMLVWQKEHGV